MSVNEFDVECRSGLYPQDIVYYDITGLMPSGLNGAVKGKIYRRIDKERNNDIGNDFRHVKYDRGGIDKLLFEDYTGCKNNTFFVHPLYYFNNVIGPYCSNNITVGYITGNTIGAGFERNILGFTFNNNTIGDNFGDNIIGPYCMGNNFGDNFRDNTLIANFNTSTVNFTAIANTLTVATLPVITNSGNFQRFTVTDALNPTYLGVVVGGGSTTCQVFKINGAWITV